MRGVFERKGSRSFIQACGRTGIGIAVLMLVLSGTPAHGQGTDIINTIAGSGAFCVKPTDPCGDGGPATAAKLDQPQDVMMTAGGFLIADADETPGPTETGDNRIRLVAPPYLWRCLGPAAEKE